MFLFAPLLLLYVATSDAVFWSEFGSRKTLTWTGFAYFALALLFFASGARAGGTLATRRELRLGPDPEPAAYQRRSLAVLLEQPASRRASAPM